MPVDTNDEAWNAGESAETLRELILEFLSDNPDQAYRSEEIADEVLDTNWELDEEIERKRQELGEDEFYDRLHAGELDDKFDRPAGALLADRIWTQRLGATLDRMEEEGVIERRRIDSEYIDLPYDWDDASYYTYSG